ncbi:MAG: hypothetical protein ACREJQ_05920 [bacterium]
MSPDRSFDAADRRADRFFLPAFIVFSTLQTLAFYSLWKFAADDAYITFRYARNLALGRGLVYNAGEHVLGTTSPFFAILLAAISKFVPVDMPWIAETVGGVAAGLAAFLLMRILRAMLRQTDARWAGLWATLFSVLFLMNPMVLRVSGMGMEAAVFNFLLLLTFWLHQTKRRGLCAVSGLCLTLTRPEGLIFMGLLFAWDYFVLTSEERGRGALQRYALYALLIAGWLVFSKAYFHTFLPTSIEAKRIYFSKVIKYGDTTRAEIENEILGSPWNRARTALLVAGAVLLIFRRRPEITLVAFMLASVGYLYYTRWRIFPWYLTSSYLVCYLVLAQVATIALKRVNKEFAWVAAAVMLFAGAGFEMKEMKRTAGMNPVQHRFFREAADRLNNLKRPDSDLFAEEIGIVGYYSDIRIEDFGGLVSPDLFPYIRKADLKGAMEAVDAEFVLFAHPPNTSNPFADLEGVAWFDSQYAVLFEIEVIKDGRFYALYRRREEAASP